MIRKDFKKLELILFNKGIKNSVNTEKVEFEDGFLLISSDNMIIISKTKDELNEIGMIYPFSQIYKFKYDVIKNSIFA